MFSGLYSHWKPFVLLITLVLVGGCGSAEVCDEDKEFTCIEDGKCIPNGKWCDMEKDCMYGSDESFAACKTPVKEMESNKFHCATGVSMNKERCNNVRDCADGSDELPQLCENELGGLYKDLNITCPSNKGQMECLPGECVDMDKRCNGIIDCSNGRDESVELCFDPCESCFQCANGKQIDTKLICDNKVDCLDGADELLSVCKWVENWVPRPDPICTEPTGENHIFTNNTKFYSNNGTLFVYANQPAELQCQVTNRTEWNVCMHGGSWHSKLPPCRTRPVFVNTNPDTNGTNGCRIDWYNNETMIIYEVEENRAIVPPLRNVRVRFQCEEEYFFLPNDKAGDAFTCGQFKEWMDKDFHPRCTRLCSPTELTKLYSMSPTCYNNETGLVLDCRDKYSLIPGTRVELNCAVGFTHQSAKDRYYVECNENGKWDGLPELCLKQDQKCKYRCYFHNKETSYSQSGEPASAREAAWVVPIYTKRNDTQYRFQCVGNLIGLNVVLTAAHCIHRLSAGDIRVGPTGNRTEIITENYYAVSVAQCNPSYSPTQKNHDVGIIILEKHIKLRPDLQIVCLPSGTDYTNHINGSSSEVISWSDTFELRSVYGVTTEPLQYTGDMTINLILDEKLCMGDSGAGVIVTSGQCGNPEQCLLGIVSRSTGAGEHGLACSDEVFYVSLNSEYMKSWITKLTDPHLSCPIY